MRRSRRFMDNYLFQGKLVDVDDAIANLIALEEERQKRKLIMIASESFAPESIRESLGSVFQNDVAGIDDDIDGRHDGEEVCHDENDLLVPLEDFLRFRAFWEEVL